MKAGMTELAVDHGRPFVTVRFPASGREAVTWLDTGGGPFIVGDALGRDLGTTPVLRELDGQELEVIDLPDVEIADRPLDVTDVFARRIDRDFITEGFPAEAFMPAHLMARHDVVLDYVALTFSLDSGSAPRGSRVPALSHPRPGWPVVTTTVAGEELNLLLDTGASCSMLSEAVIERLARNATARRRGAFGLANMTAGEWEATVEMVRLPDFAWGEVQAPSVVFVSRPEGNFEAMMSAGTRVPVVGAIAGNVLRHLRLEWRAVEQSAWIAAPAGVHDSVDQVPLVLHATNGEVRVVGLGDEAGAMGFVIGDSVVAVDELPIAGQSFGEVVAMLTGSPGDRRTVAVRRGERTIEVDAEVVAVV